MQSDLVPSVSPFSRFASESSLHGRWLEGEQLRSLAATGTNACRVFSGPASCVEIFGADALISYKDEAARDDLVRALELWAGTHRCIVTRIFGRFLPRRNDERTKPILLRGDSAAS